MSNTNVEPQNVDPQDSASNVSSNVSRTSRASTSSTTNSDKLKEEANLAELRARVSMLSLKQALETEEHRLRQQKEALELRTQLQVASARADVFKNDDIVSDISNINTVITGAAAGVSQSNESKPPELSVSQGGSEDVTIPYELGVSAQSKPEFKVIDEITSDTKAILSPTAEAFTPMGHFSSNVQAPKVSVLHCPQSTPSEVRVKPANVKHEIADDLQNNSALFELLRRQNDITKMLVDQQKKAGLPRKDIQIFDGRMQNYRSFITAFEHNIESLTASNQDTLYYLWQYTTGRPRDIVKSCMGKDSDKGYLDARRELEEEYGDEYRMIRAYEDEIVRIEPIRNEDPKALKNFFTYLSSYKNAMDSVHMYRYTDNSAVIQKLMMKLPYRLRDRWRTRAYAIREQTGTFPILHDFVMFVKEQVAILTDSVFGDIADAPRASNVKPTKQKPKSFSTNVKQVSPSVKPDSNVLSFTCAFEKPCLYSGMPQSGVQLKDNHTEISDCTKL